jgi:hypothetical protein
MYYLHIASLSVNRILSNNQNHLRVKTMTIGVIRTEMNVDYMVYNQQVHHFSHDPPQKNSRTQYLLSHPRNLNVVLNVCNTAAAAARAMLTEHRAIAR